MSGRHFLLPETIPPLTDASAKRKLLFLVTEDWYFMSHRLPLALAARDAGYEVVVATRLSSHCAAMEASGLRVVPLKHMKRSSADIFDELKCLSEIYAIIRREQPTVLHAVAIKPVIYAAICGCLLKVPRPVAALGGLGSIFSDSGVKARLFRPLVKALFRLLLNRANTKVILQNAHDLDVMTRECGVRQENVVLVRGAGVDTDQYSERPIPGGVPIVMLASRMIWPKGIQEFVDAAAKLKQKMDVRFVLVGKPDVENSASVPESLLRKWNEDGDVEWWGHQGDMVGTLGQATLVCLPTYYGEGVPKILLEAMSLGRPIITTDMPGCRELVEDGRAGAIVERRSAVSLANAIEAFLADPERLSAVGHAARELVVTEYTVEQVADRTLRVYGEAANGG
jgi:glycosyltransferase involved in cell wall biosynthesis